MPKDPFKNLQFAEPQDIEARAARGQGPTASEMKRVKAAEKRQAAMDKKMKKQRAARVASLKKLGETRVGSSKIPVVPRGQRDISLTGLGSSPPRGTGLPAPGVPSVIQSGIVSKPTTGPSSAAAQANLAKVYAANKAAAAPSVKSTVANINAQVRQDFYDSSDQETHHLGAKDLPPDRVKSALKDARKHGESHVTVKIPSHHEFTMSVDEAAALDADNRGLNQKQFERQEAAIKKPSAESVAKAKLERSVRDEVKPWDVKVDKQLKDEFAEAQKSGDRVRLTNASDRLRKAEDRAVEAEVQRRVAGGGEEDVTTESLIEGTKGAERDLAPEGKPKKVRSEAQKASLKKAHDAVREKHRLRKERAAAMGGVGGGGGMGSGGEQRHVPAGSPKGGQFMKK